MKNTLYTIDDRKQQLSDFVREVDALCDYLPNCEDFSKEGPRFRVYRDRAQKLLDTGFNQTDLVELSNDVVPIIKLHKGWIPPLVETTVGSEPPPFYSKLEKLHDRVMEIAFEFKILGKH